MFIVFMETPQYGFMLTPRVARYTRQPWAIKSRTPMGFVSLMNFLCAALPFEMAIKSGSPDGFLSPSQILQTSSAGAPLSLERGWG